MSQDQAIVRGEEQKKMTQGFIKQKVLVTAVEIKEGEILLKAERILYAENLMSVFTFELSVVVGQVPRSDQNPYGLRLESVSQIQHKEPINGK